MRDTNRIYPFMYELEKIWATYFPYMRFIQFMTSFIKYVKDESKTDPFYIEDDVCLEYLREYTKTSLFYAER